MTGHFLRKCLHSRDKYNFPFVALDRSHHLVIAVNANRLQYPLGAPAGFASIVVRRLCALRQYVALCRATLSHLSHRSTAAPSIRNIKMTPKILNTSPLHRSHVATSSAMIIGMPHAFRTIAMTACHFRRQNWNPDASAAQGFNSAPNGIPCLPSRKTRFESHAATGPNHRSFSTLFNHFKPL
jgi:hypothetical protein